MLSVRYRDRVRSAGLPGRSEDTRHQRQQKNTRGSSRRALLAGVGSGSVLLPGCSRFSSAQSREPPEPDEPPESGVDELPDPRGHVHGADGEWSSFGCNAANTRTVADGKAPVDGVSERRRVEVSQMMRDEPIVAGDRVYLLDDELHAFDADDGTELWSLEDARTTPLVREDVVYVSTREDVRTLEADSGDEVWSRELDARGSVTAPATYAGRQLICAVGERVVALDPEDGSERWHRDVFGQVLDRPAFFRGYWIVVATEAGMGYALDERGSGRARWELPALPSTAPTAGTDAAYVSCGDGSTRALTMDGESAADTDWTAETGAVSAGFAVADGLVLAVGRGTLRAIDPESGLRYWDHEIGGRGDTAPTYGRETVFVGGDRLRALDPAPEAIRRAGPRSVSSASSAARSSAPVPYSTTERSTSSLKSRTESPRCWRSSDRRESDRTAGR